MVHYLVQIHLLVLYPDERLKTNIKDYSYDLESFKKFKPKTFDWKNLRTWR